MTSVPEKQFKAGPIYVTVWCKDNGKGVSREISVSRRFKDGNGCWVSTGILRLNDIPKVVMLLQDAYRFIATNPNADEAFNVEESVKADLIEVM